MYIGALAKRTGVSIKAIRHYEEIGLIKTPRRDGKYRIYDESYVPVLNMIKLAKSLSFSLSELQTIARAKTAEGLLPMALLQQTIEQKRTAIEQEQQKLANVLSGLAQLESQAQEHNNCLLEKISITS